MTWTSVMNKLRRSSPIILRKFTLSCCKEKSDVFVYFSIWVFFHEYSQFTGKQRKGEAFSFFFFYNFHSPHKHLDISRVIATKSSPLRIAGSWRRTGNLWFPNASLSYGLFRILSFSTCTGSCCC